jgi:hypothetical protein
MKIGYKTYVALIVIGIIIINGLACNIIINGGYLLSGYRSVKVETEGVIYLSFIITTIAILILITPLLTYDKLKINRNKNQHVDNRSLNDLNLFSTVWQLLFLSYCIYYNVNIVGAEGGTSSSIKYLFFLLPADTLFLVTYAYGRGKKYFFANSTSYILSNLLRGWTGPLFLILFIEMFYLLNTKRVLNLVMLIALMIIIYPGILLFKWYIRSQGEFDVIGILSQMDLMDYSEMITFGLNHVIIRMEQISSTVGPWLVYDELINYIVTAKAIPFWQENFVATLFNNAIYHTRPLSLTTQALATYIFSGTEMQVGSSSISIPIWVFLILGGFTDVVLNLMYLLIVYMAIIQLSNLIGHTTQSRLMVFYIVFVFIIPGWIGSAFTYAYCLFIYYLLYRSGVIRKIVRYSRRPMIDV